MLCTSAPKSFAKSSLYVEKITLRYGSLPCIHGTNDARSVQICRVRRHRHDKTRNVALLNLLQHLSQRSVSAASLNMLSSMFSDHQHRHCVLNEIDKRDRHSIAFSAAFRRNLFLIRLMPCVSIQPTINLFCFQHTVVQPMYSAVNALCQSLNGREVYDFVCNVPQVVGIEEPDCFERIICLNKDGSANLWQTHWGLQTLCNCRPR